jgi:hypothetical protein
MRFDSIKAAKFAGANFRMAREATTRASVFETPDTTTVWASATCNWLE